MVTAEKMEESQLAGAMAFCRKVLNQPELRLDDLSKAQTINRIVADFDKRPTLRQCEPNPNNDQLLAVRNYELVIQNLSSFYRQVLQQIVTQTLPNGLIIVRAGRSNSGLHELSTLLNLLINAAVSSETKELYVSYIQSFDTSYQAEIVERITATKDYVADLTVPEVNYSNSKAIETHVESLLQQLDTVAAVRDANQRQLNEALQERDQIAQNSSPVVQPNSSSPTKQNTYTELAEAKQTIRMLRQEIADKEELAELSTTELEIATQREMELKQETQRVRSQLAKARADRDEIDELRTKAEQLVRSQQETTRLRERLSDFDFFKARVEELQKENSALYDSRAALETEVAANRIRLSGMGDQAEHNDRLRGQVAELEEQNLELHQTVQRLQEELKRPREIGEFEEDTNESVSLRNQSLGSEIDGSHIPENIRLKNEIKRMETINAAMIEQQSQQRNAVSDLERQLNRIKEENTRLQNQLVMEKTHSLDVEAFAKEQLEGGDMDRALEKLREKEANERLEIEEKVWEGRLQDASEKIEKLEQESVRVQAEQRAQVEKLTTENQQLKHKFEAEKRASDTESLAREEKLREAERKIRETERTIEKLNIEREQRILDKEQHTRTEQRRLQLETEIDQLRRRVDYSQDLVEKRNKEIEKLERDLQNAKKTTRTTETELRHLRELDANSAKIGSDILKLENEKRQLEAKLKQSKHREEILEREKENAVREGFVIKEKIKDVEHERDEKEKLIGELRKYSQDTDHLQRENELQQSMLEKLKQQIVDEKLKAANLASDATAAEKRAESLLSVKRENQELYQQIEQLQRQLNSNEETPALTQLQNTITQKDAQINRLIQDVKQAQRQVPDESDYKNQIDALKKQIIEVQVQRDQLIDVEAAQQRRIQQDQAAYNDRLDQIARERDLEHKENVMNEQQYINLKTIHDKLSADMETLMNDREAMRRETRSLRKEVTEAQQFVDRLQREKRELSQEMDHHLRARNEVDNNQNMNMAEVLDENGRLRDANSRLTTSYSKLKTDYTQIVDDLRTLKHKYNSFKVEHAKTETALNQIQVEAVDYEREIKDLSQRYGLLNELKDKITQENDYLQKQNQHLMEENDALNRNSLTSKDVFNANQRQYEQQIADLRRQKERVEEKMMAHYKDPSPPKKQQGILSKLKASLSKKDSKHKRKSDYAVTHVPVKSDAESEQSFQRTQSDWSRTSSQSMERSGTASGTTGRDEEEEDQLKLDDLDVSAQSTSVQSTDCISLQQFLDETNQLTPTGKLQTSYSHNDTLNRTQSDERSIRSASSAEINRRISGGALNRSTPKIGQENDERPPSYTQHMAARPAYQSPLSSSVANYSRRSEEHTSRLSASMANPRMDRLTAHKTPFERDRFAESLAKLKESPKKIFSDPRATPVKSMF